MIYLGNAYNFQLDETEIVVGLVIELTAVFDTLPLNVSSVNIQRRIVGTSIWYDDTGSTISPRISSFGFAIWEYQVELNFNDGTPKQLITFTQQSIDSLSKLYIPFLNPVKFFRGTPYQITKYFTKHFDDYEYSKRGYSWNYTADEDHPIWQTSDIIFLQIETTSDPVYVSLLDDKNELVPGFELPAQLKIPNIYLDDTFAYEIRMALAGLPNGCYRLMLEVGSGSDKQTFYSPCQYVYDGQIPDTIYVEYNHSESKADVLFETGIVFGRRFYGVFGKLDPGRSDERYRDQTHNPEVLSSVPFRQWPVHFGGDWGLTDDDIDLLNRIMGCDTVKFDNVLFGISDNAKFEFTDPDDQYRKRGLKIVVEEGVNRNSKYFNLSNNDTTKKLMWAVAVEPSLMGDFSNQGSSNEIKIFKKY